MKYVCALGVSLVCVAGLVGSVHGEEVQGELVDGSVNSIGDVLAGDDLAFIEKPTHREVQMSVDSGIIRAEGAARGVEARAQQVAVWSQVIEAEDADWVRLRFSEVVLAKSTEQVRESYLRISSLDDGYEQYLDVQSLEEWGNTTAYFNGNAVLVELMASPNATNQVNRVRVMGAQISDPVSERSICFSTDDRQLSSDPRDGRLMPIGCSGWLFGPHGSCFMSAAHCSPSGGNVMQFNVPLSSNGGGYRNPPPQDQYVVDGASVQASNNVFIGNDWAFYGTFDNSTTGLTPLQAQGLTHTLASSNPSIGGTQIRITGYGTTSSPVSPTWNGVQKTHVGPLTSISGNTVRYQTDTTGGNSGSVILNENNNTAIGIHTNAGCGSGGGANQGTSLFNSGLQNALANPQGICEPRTIEAFLVFEPTHIDPSGSDVVTLTIHDYHDQMINGVPTMFVDSGSGYVGIPMVANGADTYEGNFGALDCGTNVSYYFEIEDMEGTVVSVPSDGAAGAYETVALDELTIHLEDDFETELDWLLISNNATAGEWFRSVPGDHGLGDPSVDADGSGKCYNTANNNGVDVDGGYVELWSPVMSTVDLENPVLRLSAWMFGDVEDEMEIAFTINAGITWTVVDTFGDTNGWVDLAYPIFDHIAPGFAFRARIRVTDAGPDSTVEGSVDAFRIATEECAIACPADLTGDGVLNFFDVSAFLSAFGAQDPIADFTGDGAFNFFDVSAFLTAFGDGCP